MPNKAHTATLNRICHRYGVNPERSQPDPFDVVIDDVIIEVETSASLPEAIERLKSKRRPVYIAVTNKEGLKLATKLVEGTSIGLMDPRGNVILASGDHAFAPVIDRPE